jgi:hypothetical protein
MTTPTSSTSSGQQAETILRDARLLGTSRGDLSPGDRRAAVWIQQHQQQNQFEKKRFTVDLSSNPTAGSRINV